MRGIELLVVVIHTVVIAGDAELPQGGKEDTKGKADTDLKAHALEEELGDVSHFNTAVSHRNEGQDRTPSQSDGFSFKHSFPAPLVIASLKSQSITVPWMTIFMMNLETTLVQTSVTIPAPPVLKKMFLASLFRSLNLRRITWT